MGLRGARRLAGYANRRDIGRLGEDFLTLLRGAAHLGHGGGLSSSSSCRHCELKERRRRRRRRRGHEAPPSVQTSTANLTFPPKRTGMTYSKQHYILEGGGTCGHIYSYIYIYIQTPVGASLHSDGEFDGTPQFNCSPTQNEKSLAFLNASRQKRQNAGMHLKLLENKTFDIWPKRIFTEHTDKNPAERRTDVASVMLPVRTACRQC